MIAAWLSGLVAVVLLVALNHKVGSLRPKIHRAQLTFSEGAFRNVLDIWGEDGKRKFAEHFSLDYVFLVAYGAFGFFLASALPESRALPMHFVSLLWPALLPVAAACDCVENVLHQRFLRAKQGALPGTLFKVAGVLAAAKWLLIGTFPLLFVLWLATSAP